MTQMNFLLKYFENEKDNMREDETHINQNEVAQVARIFSLNGCAT